MLKSKLSRLIFIFFFVQFFLKRSHLQPKRAYVNCAERLTQIRSLYQVT